jgi:hypothetical protein
MSKIFIISRDYDYDGYSEPLKAFDSEEKAKAYTAEKNKDNNHYALEYYELEIE